MKKQKRQFNKRKVPVELTSFMVYEYAMKEIDYKTFGFYLRLKWITKDSDFIFIGSVIDLCKKFGYISYNTCRKYLQSLLDIGFIELADPDDELSDAKPKTIKCKV